MLKLTKEEWESERAKEKDYWVLQNLGKQINKCKLSSYYGMIQLDGTEHNGISQGCNLRDLFDTYEEAEIRALELDNLYNGIFKHKPYIDEDKLVTNLYELIEIEKKINEGLSDYPQFNGIDFCDVSARGFKFVDSINK